MFGIFNKATDPVCKMKVDKKGDHFADYPGSKYYFCSENCLKDFNEEPKKYIQQEDVAPQSCCRQNTKSCC